MSPSSARLAGDAPAVPMRWQQPDLVPRFGSADVPSVGGAAREPGQRFTLAERLAATAAEAYARGVADGRRDGEDTATARTAAVVRQLVATIDAVGTLRADMMRRTEGELVRLALTMAERIVRHEVDVKRETLIEMARLAISRLGEDVPATVHLNPIDHEAATARSPEGAAAHVQIVSDPQVAPGGCLVRSPFGLIDAGVDTQLAELVRGVIGGDLTTDGGASGHGAGE